MLSVTTFVTAFGSCPGAPPGYTLFAGHCIGDASPPAHSSPNCAVPPRQLQHGECAGNQSACVPRIARWCAGNATCHSFSIFTGGQGCAQPGYGSSGGGSGGGGGSATTRFQLFSLGAASVTANPQWASYAVPPAPTPATPAPTPTPPPPCATDLDCSLNGVCVGGALPPGGGGGGGGGTCVCDAPWHGPSCGLLRRGRTRVPGGGIYGYAAPNATTSWGGNAIAESTNGTVTWHLYASEMAGRDCGLHVWRSQSTVVHATAPTVEGPYTRRATVVGAEAHNPQAIVVNGSWYLFHIGKGDSGGTPKDCNETTTANAAATANATATATAGGGGGGGGSTLHVATSPYGPFSPVAGQAPSGCNNPSPVLHPNGTLFLFCTWSIRASGSGSPRGPWGPATAVRPPNTAARTWEDPFLWIDARGHFHVLSHTWSALPYPSNAISGHAFSADGGAGSWTFSAVEPYGNVIEHEDGTAQRFATLERPKLLFTDAARPHTPTHLINGASDFWLGGSADPCAPCGYCSRCKCQAGIDWTYTLMTPLG